MNCPKCSELIENGAAFCGNCGQPLQHASASPISQVMNNPVPSTSQPPNLGIPVANSGGVGVPTYAVSTHVQQMGEMKAILSLVFGLVGLFAFAVVIVFLHYIVVFIPLGFGIMGLVLGTMSRKSRRPITSLAGIVISSVAILIALAGWTYNISHDGALQDKTSHSDPTSTVSASSVSTPCYSLGFSDTLQISNDVGSCDLRAFNGQTFDQSSDVYKVYANNIVKLDASNFDAAAKAALEKDIQTTLPSFTIDSQKSTTFAGSQAYIAKASDSKNGIAVIEGAVLHKTAAGYNLFLMMHGAGGTSVDFDQLEAQWQWK